MDIHIVSFVLGMGAGIALHRLIMAFALWRAPDDICAYCAWMRWPCWKKDRHKNDGPT